VSSPTTTAVPLPPLIHPTAMPSPSTMAPTPAPATP
jgi:hypothetical protein